MFWSSPAVVLGVLVVLQLSHNALPPADHVDVQYLGLGHAEGHLTQHLLQVHVVQLLVIAVPELRDHQPADRASPEMERSVLEPRQHRHHVVHTR